MAVHYEKGRLLAVFMLLFYLGSFNTEGVKKMHRNQPCNIQQVHSGCFTKQTMFSVQNEPKLLFSTVLTLLVLPLWLWKSLIFRWLSGNIACTILLPCLLSYARMMEQTRVALFFCTNIAQNKINILLHSAGNSSCPDYEGHNTLNNINFLPRLKLPKYILLKTR